MRGNIDLAGYLLSMGLMLVVYTGCRTIPIMNRARYLEINKFKIIGLCIFGNMLICSIVLIPMYLMYFR